jgi:hypothetical protein
MEHDNADQITTNGTDSSDAPDFFVTGGTLKPGTPSYVPRQADADLLRHIRNGEFCYVLTARQMGKSSLMVRTARALRDQGIDSAVIDLTTIGRDGVESDEWYRTLLSQLKEAFELKANVQEFWSANHYVSITNRFVTFMSSVVLAELPGTVVIFVDEIDTTLGLNFRADFFAAIRAMYNARATNPVYNRLVFVLLGVATPTDLIDDPARTPFNIGKRIALQEFNLAEAAVLRAGLDAKYPAQGERILRRIFYWTEGHPYLTQRLCKAVEEAARMLWNDDRVDGLVHAIFFSEEAPREPNLAYVRDRVRGTAEGERRELLQLYQRLLDGERVPENDREQPQLYLKLLGLVRVDQGALRPGNRIYRRTFDSAWVNEMMPPADPAPPLPPVRSEPEPQPVKHYSPPLGPASEPAPTTPVRPSTGRPAGSNAWVWFALAVTVLVLLAVVAFFVVPR